MSSHNLPLLTAALALSLAACSPPTEPEDPLQGSAAADPVATEAMPPPAGATGDALRPEAPALDDPCDASVVQSLIGEQATDATVDQARIDAGADTARTLGPGDVVTMEYRAGRLNVDVDDTGTITGLRCG